MQGSAELWKHSGDKRSLIVLGRKNTSALRLIYPLPQSLYFEHRGETVQTRGENASFFTPLFVYYLCKGENCENTGQKSRKRLFQDACTLSILELKYTYALNFPKTYGLRRGFLLIQTR